MAEIPGETVPLAGATVGPVAVVLLVWAFGLPAWWWALPLSIVLAIVGQAIAVGLSEDVAPDPPPGKRKSPPSASKRRSRRKAKVIDLATERTRRSKEGQGNG
jgi:hypothetical protein